MLNPMLQQTRHGQAGFTIVELMVTVAVIAVLVAIAAPPMRSFIENSRIRATSESLQSGLALARAESVRQNRSVEFAILAGGWEVRLPGSAVPLHAASGNEGFGGIDLTVTPGGADRITFNQFGRTVANANASATVTSLDIEALNPPSSGIYRPLRVQIQATGAPRLCKPSAPATDSRACL